MTEPQWLSRIIVDHIHFVMLERHGGLAGVHSDHAIESALARPQNRWTYEQSDLFALAAAYGWGLAMNHGYNDGNKRTAFMAMYVFLLLNGWRVVAPESAVVQLMVGVATHVLEEADVATWLVTNATEVSG